MRTWERMIFYYFKEYAVLKAKATFRIIYHHARKKTGVNFLLFLDDNLY